jgi:hypothetical protein
MSPQELKSRFHLLTPQSTAAIAVTMIHYDAFKRQGNSNEVAAQLTMATAMLIKQEGDV